MLEIYSYCMAVVVDIIVGMALGLMCVVEINLLE